MTNKIESHQIQALDQRFPQQIPQLHYKVEQGGTIWHVSNALKIDLKWLQDMFWDSNNKNTIRDKWAQAGEIISTYYWGEPRVGNKFAMIKWNWEYLLYRQRGNEVIFTNIPSDKIKPIRESKVALHALVDELSSQEIQSA